jgi:hypothetical protein
LDPRFENESDVVLLPVGGGLEGDVAAGAGEVFLGEGGPLVGRVRLVADQHDLAFEILGAERLGAAAAGEPRADDHDPAGRHAACAPLSSQTMIAPIGQEAAASRTAASFVWCSVVSARPSAARRMLLGASWAQLPKPLHRERSISMRYT